MLDLVFWCCAGVALSGSAVLIGIAWGMPRPGTAPIAWDGASPSGSVVVRR